MYDYLSLTSAPAYAGLGASANEPKRSVIFCPFSYPSASASGVEAGQNSAARQIGHVEPPCTRWPFRHPRQKMWPHARTTGSVYGSVQMVQSSVRLAVTTEMTRVARYWPGVKCRAGFEGMLAAEKLRVRDEGL